MSSSTTTPPMDMETAFSAAPQLKDATIRGSRPMGKPKPYSYKSFFVWNDKSRIEGRCPTVKFEGATLGAVGKSGEGKRGFDVIEWSGMKKDDAPYVRLGLGLSKEGQGEVIAMMQGVLKKFLADHDPIKDSKWYQSAFASELTDGTKVHLATKGLQDGREFVDMTFTGDDLSWDSPSRTWGPAVYGSDDSVRFYPRPRVIVDDDTMIYTSKTDDRVYSDVVEESVTVYPRTGIHMDNRILLNRFLASEHYKEKHWRAKGMLRMSSFELICSQIGEHPDTKNPIYGVAPKFNLQIVGSVLLTEAKSAIDDSPWTDDERAKIMHSMLFQGIKGSVGGRKRKAGAGKAAAKKSKSSPPASQTDATEVIEDTDGED